MKISLVFMTLIVPVVLGDEAKPASLRGGYSGETPDPAARNVTSRALQSCTNYPNWYDTTGPTYTCNWYAQKGFCPYPGTTPSVGLMSVTEACCSCGGGCTNGRAPTTTLTYDSVKAAMLRKGYKFFTGPYNLNLIGIRGPNRCPDNWDDTFLVLYQDNFGKNQIKIFGAFTTDPGKYYLQNPIDPAQAGCAIVAPGQYRSVWSTGLHKGYDALVQKGSIDVFRDNNKNGYLNFVSRKSQSGIEINLHKGGGESIVGVNSAGCQVFQSGSDLTTVLGLAKQQKAYGYGSYFSYTLLEMSSL